jgi:serine/threonine-protein kinase
MTPERWQKIQQLYHAALEREEGRRAAYLHEVCPGDDALRQEVESLLAQTANSFLEVPALEAAAKMLGENTGESFIGRQIGFYQVRSLLGTGGMGEVYRAHDARLDRDVALKVLPAGLLADEAARRRFRKEALALAKLSHSHIAVIHDVGEEGGMDYLVMECVPGQSLAEKLSIGALLEKEVVSYGAQIADALEEAHEHGVIHRDLKPGNLMITPKGQVKVLDFGLAKLLRPANDMMATENVTETQSIAGTLPYMAPEQLTGEPADARTDIYALGAVLFEMAVGRRPFQEDSTPRLTDAILHQTPVSPRTINSRVSPEMERIILKCLEKSPENRYQSAKEVQVDLHRLTVPATVAARLKARSWWRNRAALGIAAVALIAVLVTGFTYRFAGRGETIDSVAVLPFMNGSGDPNTEYLSQGIARNIVNNLSQLQLPNLRVVPWSTVSRYTGRQVDPQGVGRALKVRAVLLGTVMQRGDSLTIQMELVDIVKVSQLWGQQYERKLTDILPLQEQMATDISNKLRLRLNADEQQRLTKRYTENAEAHLLYLKGRNLASEYTPERLQKAAKYFLEAIDVDPNYALAYAGLASSYVLLVRRGASSPKGTYPSAKSAAEKALAIDDTLSEAHNAQGVVRTDFDRDWSGAEKEFKRAIALDPTFVEAHHQFSHFLEAGGRTEESLAESQRVLEIDPLDPVMNAHLGWHYVMARRADQAIVQCQKALEIGNTYWGHYYLGQAYEQKARYDEAIAEFNKALEISGASTEAIAALGHAYAVSGKRREAQRVLGDLDRLSEQRYVSLGYKALIYAGLGDREQAFKWLQKADEEGSGWLIYLNVDPRYDSLRSDPRFRELLRRTNLQL